MKYEGKELKFIKDYGTWVLFEHPEGYKEGIHKHSLGLVKPREYKRTCPILRGIHGNIV